MIQELDKLAGSVCGRGGTGDRVRLIPESVLSPSHKDVKCDQQVLVT